VRYGGGEINNLVLIKHEFYVKKRQSSLPINHTILGGSMPHLVALITPHTLSHRTAEETLALGYLASVLRSNGYGVTIIDGWLRGVGPEEIAQELAQNVPDVICMSCYRSNLDQAIDLLAEIAKKCGSIPIICGGYGPTFHDEDFLNAGFTVAVRGEAEHVITRIVDAIVSNSGFSEIPGVTYVVGNGIVRTERAQPILNLDELPFPSRDEIHYAMARKNPIHVCTSRGCKAHCQFCSIFTFALGASRENRWRHRSIKNIVDELRSLYEKFGVTHIKFVDDSFLEPPRDVNWVFEFVETLSKYDLPLRFRTQVRADRLNEDIVSGMKRAGWFATSVGIENAAPSALRRMGKDATVEDNWHALEMLHRHGIYVQMGMILFDDATTMNELEVNHHFLTRHDWVVTKGIFTEMFAAEGTPYTKKLVRKGKIQISEVLQNHRYEVANPTARRVYQMLKAWHKSHSSLYDWVIDSISAPKVLPDEGYQSVHALCQQLTACDTKFFRYVLDHVASSSPQTDVQAIERVIVEHAPFYATVWAQIRKIYDRYGLVYDGIPNPFLT
jgi:anaerobic magnesium-protoporphyrin IX monomethyl ester cyclase